MKKERELLGEESSIFVDEDEQQLIHEKRNWLLNHISGETVLQIGDDKAMLPILLGREGKAVDVIDNKEATIDNGSHALQLEHETVQNKVRFQVTNFLLAENVRPHYDVILLLDMLQEVGDSTAFLEKVKHHLLDEGELLITVPFGVRDNHQQKRTYYFLDVINDVSKIFRVKEFIYIGASICVICKKHKSDEDTEETVVNEEEVRKLENAFYAMEQLLRRKNHQLQLQLRSHMNQVIELEKEVLELLGNEERSLRLNLEVMSNNQRLEEEIGYLKKLKNNNSGWNKRMVRICKRGGRKIYYLLRRGK